MNIEKYNEIRDKIIKHLSGTCFAINSTGEGLKTPDPKDYMEEFKDVLVEVIGICGCGDPERALEIYQKALEWCENGVLIRKSQPFEDNDDLSLIVLYNLHDKELTSHGTGIGGSWLTEKGKLILDIMRFRKEM